MSSLPSGHWRLQRAHLNRSILHQRDQRIQVLLSRKRLVALNIHIHVRRNLIRNFMHALGSAARVGRRHAYMPAILFADGIDLVGIRGDNHVVQPCAAACRFIDPRQHGTSGNLAQNLAGQARRRHTRRNHSNDVHSARVPTKLARCKERRPKWSSSRIQLECRHVCHIGNQIERRCVYVFGGDV